MPTRKLVTSYEEDLRLFGDMWHKVGIALAVIAVLGFPLIADAQWISIANGAMIAIVGAVGMMILTGFAGQISLGHAAFLAVGAYTAAILGERLHLPFWLGMPIGGIFAAVVGLIIGPFALRLRGLYLAIVTLGLVALVNHTLMSVPELTHGASGIAVPTYGWFPGEDEVSSFGTWGKGTTIAGVELTFQQMLYFVYAAVAVLAAFASKNIQRSDTGRAMIAVRDHDLAAAVLGVHPAKTKIIAFGISSFWAGIAGAMFAYQQQYITIEPPFDLSMSVMYIAIIVLGGIGTTFGAVAGAIIYTVLSPLAEIVGRNAPLLSELSSSQQSTILFALIVCAFLVFEPLGSLGLWLKVKRYFTAWPFRY
jgi:branched-chain amino acid transport system permease protein